MQVIDQVIILEINRPSWNKGFRGSHDIIYDIQYMDASHI